MKNTITFFVTALFLLLTKINAQTWQNIPYSPTGLPSNKINTVCSDAGGNYWIATKDSGIVRLNNNLYTKWTQRDRITANVTWAYQGGSFGVIRVLKAPNEVLYMQSEYNPNYFGIIKYDSIFHWIKSPFNFHVEPSCSDKSGNLWFRANVGGSGNGGAVRYNPSSNSWSYFNVSNSGIKSNTISDITADSFGNVWFGHATNFHVSKFDGLNWRWYLLHPNFATNVQLLKADKTGNIYFSDLVDMYKYNKLTDTILPVTSPQAGGHGGVIGIDEANNVLAVKDNQTFPASTRVLKLSPTGVWSSKDIQGLGLSLPYTLDVFNPNEFWVTILDGIYRFRDSSYSLFNKSNSGIYEDRTTQIIKGRMPNEIIACHYDALSFLDTIQKTSKTFDKYNSGLFDDLVDDIFIDSKGNKWISKSDYLVQKLGPDNKSWEYYDNDSLLFVGKKLKNREDKYGNIWFYNSGGVTKISPNGAITNIGNESIFGSGTSDHITSVTIVSNGDLWIYSILGIIKKYNGTSWIDVACPFPISMRGGTFISTDINNNIWISRGYFNNFRVLFGLARYNLNNNTWDSVDLGLNTSINDIYSDRAGRLWLILPDSGVACYDGQSLIRYHKGNSNILSNNINDIHVDSLGKVWFSTNLGISVLTPAPATVPNITTAAAINITESSAQVTGTILSNGGSIITAKGICWSVNANPTISNNKTVETTGNLSFISTLNGLTSGTKYYARAYAINAVGTAYGNEISFTTNNPIPGCVNAVLWPTAAVTVPQIAGQTIEITPGNGDIDCNFAGEYSRTDGWKDGLKYTVYSTNATDFITITDDNNNIIKSGTQPLEINNSGTGVKRIHVNLNSNCDKEDKCRDISVKLNGSTGLFDLDKTNHFSIYPNPSQGLLYLETDKIDFTTDPIIVKLYNTLGQEIPITYSAVNKTIIKISAPNTKSGIYSLYMRGNAQDYKTTIQIAD